MKEYKIKGKQEIKTSYSKEHNEAMKEDIAKLHSDYGENLEETLEKRLKEELINSDFNMTIYKIGYWKDNKFIQVSTPCNTVELAEQEVKILKTSMPSNSWLIMKDDDSLERFDVEFVYEPVVVLREIKNDFNIGDRVSYKYDLSDKLSDTKGYDVLFGDSVCTIKNIITDIYSNQYLQFEEVIKDKDIDYPYESSYFKIIY